MAATGYIENIQQRTSAVVTIHYYSGGSTASIEVPITPRSVRRFSLMQDDYIQLEFSLEEPVNIGIGSYFTDSIFGQFFITSEQMPRYNQTTGGYDYSLRFDKDYMRWKNFLHCLVSNSKRMETSWTLTDKLAVHAQQIADNVNIIFPPTVFPVVDPEAGTSGYNSNGYAVKVDADLASAGEIKFISYDGTDIISALNRIAEAYGCEWWVDGESVTVGTTTFSRCIHFGKCELDNSRFVLSLDDNVESIDASRDQQTFANRIFAYGGTQNVPESYDRQLIFKADTTTRNGTKISSVEDSQRPLTLEMIKGAGSVTPTIFSFGNTVQGGTSMQRTYTQSTETRSLSGEQTFNAALTASLTLQNDDWAGTDIPQVSVIATLVHGNTFVRMHVDLNSNILNVDGKTWTAEISLSQLISLGSTAQSVYAQIVWTVNFEAGSFHLNDAVDCGVNGSFTATADASTATKAVVVRYNNTNYAGTFNGADGKILFGSNMPPSAFANKNYTVTPLDELKVPLSYYTPDYDTGTLRMVGEKRLHLPLDEYPNRYIDTANTQSEDTTPHAHSLSLNEASQTIEAAVVFNEVYPRLTLRIKQNSLSQTPKKQKVEHSDGSVTWEDWTQYTFKAEYNSNGSWVDFPFKLEYMLDGAKLQAVFLAPESAQESGFLLAGMTFDVGFTQGYGGSQYTIIRNEEYGVLLPNKVLKPTEGDTFVLTGWNPRALDELGIVAAAEQELASKAEEYLDAIQEGQFTFNVRMMSNVFYTWAFGGRGAASNGLHTFGLLALGARVTINHAALPGGSKDSRVIGYEYKLDFPNDTPTYIIGETDAYSRLKQIEKQLTKLT